jgi:hypothetical protein
MQGCCLSPCVSQWGKRGQRPFPHLRIHATHNVKPIRINNSFLTGKVARSNGFGFEFYAPLNLPRPKEKWPFMVCVVMIVLPARATDEWRCTEPGTLILLGR